jgi:hypothetical protein
MELILPHWAFALLPLPLLVASIFWGAPAIALVSELIGIISGKPFPARTARQMSRLALGGHVLFWLLVIACAAALASAHSGNQPLSSTTACCSSPRRPCPCSAV